MFEEGQKNEEEMKKNGEKVIDLNLISQGRMCTIWDKMCCWTELSGDKMCTTAQVIEVVG